MLVAIKLAKAGYGTVGEIFDTPLDAVIGILEYERFLPEYEERFVEINKDGG